MKKNSILFALLLAGGIASAQQNFWQVQKGAATATENVIPRLHDPSEATKMHLNYNQLIDYLTQTQARNTSLSLKFPDDKGNFNTYKIVEESNFHPDLQAKYSEIRSYTGYNVENPAERINFSISPQFGLYGSINGNGKNILIDTYTNDHSTYLVYDKSKLLGDRSKFTCNVDHDHIEDGLGIDNLDFSSIENTIAQRNLVNDSKLRTFRLAITTTTEYSNFIISRAGLTTGTVEQQKAAVLAAVNLSLTRINGVLKNEVGIHFQLVPNTDQLFFIEEDTFNATSASQMLSENIAVTNRIIGTDNYDMGHLFFKVDSADDSNGLASVSSICMNSSKAGGVTGTVTPIGDPFDIDFTAHEIGHQLGAHHTQNNSCNRSSSTAVEPGSGSTIMAYTGICSPNVQSNSDAYYHQISLYQMNSILSQSAYNCGVNTTFDNVAPVISNTKISYNIPHSTAFALTLNATDANNDTLTYSWEQYDTTVGEKMPPVSGNTKGPMFRSLSPSTSPTRFFPKMDKILADQIVFATNTYSNFNLTRNNWEVVPNNARNLTFSGTVRDNNPNVGQTASKNFLVSLKAVGPFKVTSLTTRETWNVGDEKTITWDVAGTNANTINTQNVKILISTDAGATWDYTLVESTPNNGSYTFTVPRGIGETTNARIMIRPVDNIYLAVNKTNFTINSPLAVGDVNKLEVITITPNPSNGEVNIAFNKDFNNTIIYVNDMTGKQVYNFNSTSKSKSHKLSLNHLTNGVYIVTVKADGEQFSKKLIIKK